ncbi:MAG: TIGR01841 family phasin [Asticcacaulis sp.]|uniref:phasin family protein n=1 Tax=Asticcacaulis tiandongensis TaxID=2565365 RepID=UPI001127947D|nr:TIGR01841 family phasin [Asticcacaulis tiandongensis]
MSAEEFKATTDRVAAAGNQAFKDGVEKSIGALNELNSLSKSNIEALVESFTAATKGAEAVGAQTAAFTKKNWEEGVAAAKSLSSAKSVQEVVELQSAYAKKSLESYVAELNSLTETLSASFKDSFKPINTRLTASVEKFQSFR